MDILLFAQTFSLLLPTLWLTTGVRDNILHPPVNEVFTAQVLTMERMKEDFPEEYERVAHRAIHSRGWQKGLFRLIVAAEITTAVVLWVGVLAMALAALGIALPSMARGVALIGALMFTGLWSMFTVVGNHFSYWFCHEGAQNTHFQLLLWGLGNMIFLNL
ncbi:DUF2165 family protein [Shimia haliotis]|uniref:Predicted small integral membrane protein n=1 Tax=Shimia haliotis TaxID=1280847 RepID=A0A1I4GFB2_9RHOB|nr:DUF2165 family protein [Shimia haliotis]SFL28223.1 Predicted small integral membrane protein [Shimia haliotis]